MLNTSFHCLFYFSVFSDAEKSDCGLRDNPAVNYIRLSSRRGQINDQTYVGFLRISDNEPVPSPIRVFHWDTYSMYGSDRDQEFPVYLMDVIGFGENLFVQMETTAPAPIRRRSKKRSQKKASERRLSKQAVVTEGWVEILFGGNYFFLYWYLTSAIDKRCSNIVVRARVRTQNKDSL